MHLFNTRKQFTDFLDMRKGETLAEIGAAEGYNIGVLSMLSDSVSFYAQDIDAKTLTQKAFDKNIKRYEKLRKRKQTNTFHLVIGTIHASNLPEGIFDKILIIDSYHDFDQKDEMITDLSKKLKPDGKLIILDGFSFPADTQTCRACGTHVLTTLDVEVKRLEQHGFYLTQMRSPYFKAYHYGNGLVFERNKTKSDAFYKLKNAVDATVTLSYRFKQAETASDSMAVQSLINDLTPHIAEITRAYPEYEVWMNEMGLTYLRQNAYSAAVGVLKASAQFYPSSYQAFYWLGVAYQESGQYGRAFMALNRSLVLQSQNEACRKRLQVIEPLLTPQARDMKRRAGDRKEE
ncbi:MAG TPA: class I SAM-dependent methyltransferase [Bacteroidia bacterium]|nr:class I SAM-dependent methyltransferase [Bacteroidia bacterium]